MTKPSRKDWDNIFYEKPHGFEQIGVSFLQYLEFRILVIGICLIFVIWNLEFKSSLPGVF